MYIITTHVEYCTYIGTNRPATWWAELLPPKKSHPIPPGIVSQFCGVTPVFCVCVEYLTGYYNYIYGGYG